MVPLMVVPESEAVYASESASAIHFCESVASSTGGCLKHFKEQGSFSVWRQASGKNTA